MLVMELLMTQESTNKKEMVSCHDLEEYSQIKLSFCILGWL
jgi:hypothetical protein